MPLRGIPSSIHPELLYVLAKMGHGDIIVIADANFPSDSISKTATVSQPIRVRGTTSDILADILTLFPLDSYSKHPIIVMDRVEEDKLRNLIVPAYEAIANSANIKSNELHYMERFEFYNTAKNAFAIVQTDDLGLYANVIISKGVITK